MRIVSNYNNINQTTPNFKKLQLQKFFNKSRCAADQEYLLEKSARLGSMIHQPSTKIYTILTEKSERQVGFFRRLVEIYNVRNFSMRNRAQENSETIFAIMNNVKKPEYLHHSIARHHVGSMESLNEIFMNAKDEKSLLFVQTMQKKVFEEQDNSASKILALLKSHHKPEYVESPDKYTSYLKLNKDNDDVVKSLDKLLDDGVYNSSMYDKEYAIKSLMKNKEINVNLKEYESDLKEHYTKNRDEFLKTLFYDFLCYRQNSIKETVPEIVDMYKTTTSNNSEIRTKLIHRFQQAYSLHNKEKQTDDIRALKSIFDKIDTDKNVAKFVQKALKKHLAFESTMELNEILELAPAKKLDIFIENLSYILANARKEERKEAVEFHLRDSLYIPKSRYYEIENSRKYGFSSVSTFEKLRLKALNFINNIRYKLLINESRQKKAAEAAKEAVKVETATISKPVEKEITPIAENIKPEPPIQEVREEIAPVIEKVNVETPTQEVVAETVIPAEKTVDETPIKEVIEEITPAVKEAEMAQIQDKPVKESYKERKARLANEISDFVKKILGAKTYEQQAERYTSKPTKMRLRLLPDLFDSIRTTRMEAKKSGKKPRVENKKAINIFENINGKNRKLVRYMLKKNGLDSQRVFDIKDIENWLKADEKYIAEQKLANPEFNEKAYFNELFDMLNEEYGKVNTTRNFKISDKNKKLIRYMMKKQTSENKNLFELKDIAKWIKADEKYVEEQKRINPNFDENAYYNELIEMLINEYGKVQTPKKK